MSETTIKLAARMYEARDEMRRLLGDSQNCDVSVIGCVLLLSVRSDRFFADGAARSKSLPHVCAALPGKRDFRGRAILKEIADGDRKFMGSSLVVVEGRAVMFLTYSVESEEPRKSGGVAVVRPARKSALAIRVGGRVIRIGGDCADVGAVRMSVQGQRWSRQAKYRWAGSSTKGHGRRRAIEAVTRLAQQWKNFQKTRNCTMSAEIGRLCEERGVQRVVFVQPTNDVARSSGRLLAVSGNPFPLSSTAGWDWYSLGTILANRLERSGVALHRVKRTGERG